MTMVLPPSTNRSCCGTRVNCSSPFTAENSADGVHFICAGRSTGSGLISADGQRRVEEVKRVLI
jgi:hypothetical protein